MSVFHGEAQTLDAILYKRYSLHELEKVDADFDATCVRVDVAPQKMPRSVSRIFRNRAGVSDRCNECSSPLLFEWHRDDYHTLL